MPNVSIDKIIVTFTAEQFLREPNRESKYRKLPEQLKKDPERLGKEFLAIAKNPKQPFPFRSAALAILSRHSEKLCVSGSLEITKELVTAFDNEFPAEKLNDISEKMRSLGHYPDGLLVHLFCIAFAKFSPETTHEKIEAIREVLAGTCLEAPLNKHLQGIKQKGSHE